MKDKAKMFKALGDETRLTIVSYLLSGECCACAFTKLAPKDQTTISRHLKVLFEAGILRSERRGKFIYYSIKDDGMKAHLREMGLKPCC
jgi:ArsR family transcriptional regulator